MGVNGSVLLLNQNYEPLNICNSRRAFSLVSRGKAEVLENSLDGLLRTPNCEYRQPSVIRMVYLIHRPRPRAKLTRREVFLRDQHTCQYCGAEARDLTLDHVVPRRCGGKHHWDNLVSACRACNHRKGGQTLEEAHMRLRRPPFQPRPSSYYGLHQHLQHYSEWRKFIPEWELARA